MSFDDNQRWLARARRTVPNGIFGHHRSYAFAGSTFAALPDRYPHFVRRAQDCRFWDLDGNEYIDYLCGYGSMIVGYREPRIEEAVAGQLERGVCHSFPTELYAELAELLVERQQDAEWAALSLNGSDAIHFALLVARAHTGREGVVVAHDAYHGNQPWCSFGPGRIEADRGATRFVTWGAVDEIEAALADSTVAALVLCPFEQLVGAPNRLPEPGFWSTVRDLCDRHGTLLIIDDVRSGFRLDQRGTCARFGIEPDLVCLSKAIANGHPLAAVTGRAELRETSETVFAGGTFWGYSPALAAALATQSLLSVTDAAAHMAEMGRRLVTGLVELARTHGFELSVSGPEAMPLLMFAEDEHYRKMRCFAQQLALRGSFVHPTHNWFLSLAHEPKHIAETLRHAEGAFASMTQTLAESEVGG